ncbi:MAG: hypothetical protein ACWGNV_13310 [Bacteroidales bacterium]
MTKSISIVTLVLFIVFLGSCGGNQSPSELESNSSIASEEKSLTPDEIGAAVSDLYVQAMTDLNTLLENEPPADEVKDDIAALKEKYVQQLVKYGQEREEMDESDRSKMDLAIRLGLNDVYDDQTYTDYSEHINNYFDDTDVRELLSSFNILTQYANFDLLRQQEPEEAQRLGIG